MGAETHVINNASNGFNINVDRGSTHIQRLQDFVARTVRRGLYRLIMTPIAALP